MLISNIFKHLFEDDEYFNSVFPHLHKSLFTDTHYQTLFDKISVFSEKYNKRPEIQDINLMISRDLKVSEEVSDTILGEIEKYSESETIHTDLIVDETEQWVKDRTMEMAILEAVEILENDKPRGKIQDIVKDALSVTFKNEVGHEYLEDAEKQYDFYTTEETKMPCDIDVLNDLLGGGFVKKALYILIGRVNVGKSIFLCHLASSLVAEGYNVVLITAEMAEERMVQRVDANSLNIEMDRLTANLSKKDYFGRVKDKLSEKGRGRFFVKEYPTGSANKNHMISYLKELKIKKNFKADIIIADYLNIFASSRLPSSNAMDSYKYIKSIAEEFRALAVEEDVAVVTATQLNRASANTGADEMDMTGTSDSWGVPATADWMGAIIQNEELFDLNKYLIKNIKTRFDGNLNEVVTIGVDRNKMRLLNLEEEEQEIPITVKDKMEYANEKREKLGHKSDDTVWVFDDEL